LLSDVWFAYPDSTVPIIRGLELSVPLSRCTILVGPTGAGKSTILKILRGFYKLHGGRIKGKIRIQGIDYAQLTFDDITSRGIVFMHQDPHSNIHLLSVRDEIQSGLVYNNFPWEQIMNIADKTKESMGISYLVDRCTEQLSEGELQKIGIASSLALCYGFKKSPILLLDSPMSLLDGRSQDELIETLKGLKKQDVTILIACPDLGPYKEIADKAVLIAEGRKVKEGSAEAIIDCQEYNKLVGVPLVSDADFLKSANVKNSKEDTGRAYHGSDYAFTFQNIRFSYNDSLVFNNISGEIGRLGTVTAIFGHNGSGKTTLIKLMLGILKPLKGEILLFGKNPQKYSASEIGPKIAFVTQNPTEMFVSNTVEEECLIAPINLHVNNPEALVSQALKLTHLDHLTDRSVDSLSGGERRLLSLACTALVSNCSLVILEEPDLALNPNRWKEVLKILLEFRQSGKTVILTTHAIETAILCDEILVLSGGNLVFRGTSSEFLNEKQAMKDMGNRQNDRLLKIKKIMSHLKKT